MYRTDVKIMQRCGKISTMGKYRTTRIVIYTGIIWTVVFAGMSFYWAAGGMLGVETLGGEIEQKALERNPSFVPVVWATGIVKLLGALLLSMLLLTKLPSRWKTLIRWSCMAAGWFMVLYGAGNMVTISMADRLGFDLSVHARMWRLLFWEPYWIVGGVLYVWSGWRQRYGTKHQVEAG